jgi:hypothetical protein
MTCWALLHVCQLLQQQQQLLLLLLLLLLLRLCLLAALGLDLAVLSGMQDWAYLAAGTMELTLEVNNQKDPSPSELLSLWQQNVAALLNLPIVAVLQGASGRVLSASDGHPLAATVIVEDLHFLKTPSSPRTGYWNRPLAPGTYTLTASAPGYIPSSVQLRVPESGAGVKHTFKLSRRRH